MLEHGHAINGAHKADEEFSAAFVPGVGAGAAAVRSERGTSALPLTSSILMDNELGDDDGGDNEIGAGIAGEADNDVIDDIWAGGNGMKLCSAGT